jgi:Ca-activated chloride channel homolog
MILLGALVAFLSTPPESAGPPATPVRPFVITGSVRDAGTQRPLADVQVMVQGRSLGMTTDTSGRFRLVVPTVRAGATLLLRTRRIGYEPDTRSLVARGDSVMIDIALRVQVLQLHSVVVTAQAASPAGARPQAAAATVSLRATSGTPKTADGMPAQARRGPFNREQYAAIEENPFRETRGTPLSTFAIDVDRASYANVRRFLDNGDRPPRDAVRIEELVNYFAYDYEAPTRRSDPLTVSIETHAAPWQPMHRLVRIGMQAQRLTLNELPPANLVFLVDVSGSMGEPNKLPLHQWRGRHSTRLPDRT